jgi:aryl-alcohol dehydrogenase-like predicted oxidoreductase
MSELPKSRTLGLSQVPAVGLGCMGMSEFYGETNDDDSLKTLQAAFDLGYRHFDTSDMYGRGHNEELLGRFIKSLGSLRQDITVASKFGIYRDPDDKYKLLVSGRREYVKQACEASLKRLQVEVIDLYYVHRRDSQTPIEETMGALAELVQEGKIKAIGLSEVSAETLRKAHRVHPVAALQSEYSLWSRGVEREILPTCRELGIAFVAYSPLGRGFLTGAIDQRFLNQMDKSSDFRAKLPRFQQENLQTNLNLVEVLKGYANEVGCSPAQLALAWILQQGADMHVIPGTKRIKYVQDNFQALHLNPDRRIVNEIAKAFPVGAAAGERYPDEILKGVNL